MPVLHREEDLTQLSLLFGRWDVTADVCHFKTRFSWLCANICYLDNRNEETVVHLVQVVSFIVYWYFFSFD